MAFEPRDWREILVDMISYIVSNTPISSVNPGSVTSTLMEASALEDAEQYYQMLEIIRNYSLNTTSGTDLDNRASEYGLVRNPAKTATSYVTIGDSAITKVQTTIYSGLTGPKAGDTLIYGDEITSFTSSGSIIIGRGTNNVESIAYSSITEFSNYIRFNLSSALQNDHGTDESIVLSQGGNRITPAGTKVKVLENDISAEVVYSTSEDAILLDGEENILEISITADASGSEGNSPAGLISSFVALPFSTAIVVNPAQVTSGEDEETDSELRDRIKLHIQGLSRGTTLSIYSSIIGLEDSDSNTRVVSAKVVETNETGKPSTCYIDDGSGFEPTYLGQGYETVILNATGGEQILQLEHYPLVKAFSLSSNSETFDMTGALDLVFEVNGVPETVSFATSDWDLPAEVSSEDIVRIFNLRSSLAEARTTQAGSKIILKSQSLNNEEIEVTGGTANAILGFPLRKSITLLLYKNFRTLLSKDGSTAVIESGNGEAYTFVNNDSLLVKIDGRTGYQEIKFQSTDTESEDVVIAMNLQVQGAVSVTTSTNTKVSLISNTENSSSSIVKIGRDGSITNATNGTIFRDSTLPDDFPFADQLVGLRILMTSGTYSGNAQEISAYDETIGEITVSSTIGGTPSVTDTYVIDGMANGNAANPATTTDKLDFSSTAETGSGNDYSLNRSQGQIELDDILLSEDTITCGTPYSRGQVETSSNSDFSILAPSTLTISVEGAGAQTINFPIATYTVASAVALINLTLIGARALASPNSENKLAIRTNKWEESVGSIQVTGGTANTVFNFPTTVVTSFEGHYSNSTSQNKEDDSASEYTFSEDSSVIIVIDSNLETPYNVTLSYDGTITLGDLSSPQTTFRDSSLITQFTEDEFFTGFFIKVTSGASIGKMRIVSSYTAATAEFVTADFGSNLEVGSTFKIIPRTALNVAKFLSSTTVTGMSLKANIEEYISKYVNINSKTAGSLGSVNVTGGTGNSLSLSFATDGLVGGTFTAANKTGVMEGLEVKIQDSDTSAVYGFITSITGAGPYTFTIETARSGGAVIDLSTYTVAQSAYISPRNLLNFSTGLAYGLDAYSYYTGLLQKVQWTIDGKEDDLITYPGVKAAGVQVEVKEPSTNRISVTLDVTTIDGVSLSSIQEDIKSAVSNYINNLGVSDDVIVSEIIDRVMGVEGAYDVEVSSPTSNIAVGDGEIVRISDVDVIVG